MNAINEYQQTAVDYKRRISGSFMLVEPAKVQSKLSGSDFCVTRKIDGIMQCVFWHNGQAFMAGSGGKILTDLPCLDEFAKCVQAAGLDSVTVAAELYYPLAEGRPRCHDVLRALAVPEERGKLELAPFDLLEYGGEPYKSAHYKETHHVLSKLFSGKMIRPVEMRAARSREEVGAIFDEWVVEEGAEGLVVHSESPIVWKLKPRHTIDAAVVGYTATEAGIRDLLFAVRREDGKFQAFTSGSNGLASEQRLALLETLKQETVESQYIRTDSENNAYQMVSPRMVFEISVNELISESNTGKIKRNPLLDFDPEKGWLSCGSTPGVSALAPAVVRLREDKTPGYESIRVSQLSDLCPFAENPTGDGPLPKSTLLSRRVFRKTSGNKVMLQKFLIWKTNKEQSGKFPSYVFYFTDYSSGRKEFLKRDLRVSGSERQIRAIMEEFITENIKKGWQEAI
jgi:hypothetical protein